MLADRNDEKSSNGAVFRRVLLATMKAQQAVAIRFVGRRVTTSTCLFFDPNAALCAFISLARMSLQRDEFVVATTD